MSLRYLPDYPIARKALEQEHRRNIQRRSASMDRPTERIRQAFLESLRNPKPPLTLRDALLAEDAKPKPHKYHACKTVVDGITFDSKKEAKRYGELKILLAQGHIKSLDLQPEYELIPKQNGERACKYIADFRYLLSTISGEMITVVEDCKGMKTPAYIIKRKLMRQIYGIKIREI